ncbi:MAG TPA: phosphatase domain-containing protein [Bacteroidia bacterium]|jgi:phosphatidate phosphatase APP1
MEDWKSIFYKLGNSSESYFDRLKLKLRQRLGLHMDIQILTYMTYANSKELYIRGRILLNKNIEISDRDTIWKNLHNTYKRLCSIEIAGARLRARFNNTEHEFFSDEDGYFELPIPLQNPLPSEELWHHPLIELLECPFPFQAPVHVRAEVMTPPSTARFGIISDIDDTVLTTHAQSLLKSAYMTFTGNAYSRLPFEGVSAFYTALQKGLSGAEENPIFYVSSSPWNLYDLLVDFLELNKIPKGPLFLKDYGFTHNKLFTESHGVHKPKQIRNILNAYPEMNFILIGDSGQHDPEIYAEVIKEFPGRILASYIRDVSVEERDIEVRKISEGILHHKVEMVLAENSYTAAEHAAAKGFINSAMLPVIKAEKRADEIGKDSAETIIEEEIKKMN